MSETFTFDVFLSHSAKDKAVVRPLAERLRKDGLKVWFDEWEIKPGDSIPSKIEEGLERTRVLVLCMSANAFGSDWAQLESGTFRFRDPLNKERRFLPLRLDEAPIKGSLAQFLYITWRPAEHQHSYTKLLDACQPTVSSMKATPLLVEGATQNFNIASRDAPQVGGALSPGSRFYVERETDKILMRQFADTSPWCVTVIAPRMMGKSSLIRRLIAKDRRGDRTCIFLDFQGIGRLDLSGVVCGMAFAIAEQIGGIELAEAASRVGSGKGFIITQFSRFLRLVKSPLVLALDEVDALRSMGIGDDFFSFLRNMYTSQYMHEAGPISLLVSSIYTTSDLQRNEDASPFAIGNTYTLCNFNLAETKSLLKIVCPAVSVEDVMRLHQMTGGHPFLVHAVAELLTTGQTTSEICDPSRITDGALGMFMEIGRAELSRNAEVRQALIQFALGKTLHRQSVGELIRRGFIVEVDGGVAFASELHRRMITHER